MPIQVTCPACRQTLQVPDELIGQMVRCPSCQSEFSASLELQTAQLDPALRPAELGPPVRLPPLPEQYYDDEWNDDIEFRRRGVNRDRARSEVLWPAAGMITISAINLLLGLVLITYGISEIDVAQTPHEKTLALRSLIQGPIALVSSVVMLLGGVSMLKLKRHGLATTSAVLAMVPCTSPCCIIGLPIGVWAMVVLTKTDVKRAFSLREDFG